MFSTLRYTKDSSKATVCIEQANDPPGQGHGQRHSACIHCRTKKLKCLGETKNSERKEGSSCNRCRTNGIKCVFPQPATTKGSKRRRSTHTSRPPKSSSSKSSSPATMISTAPSPQLQTGVVHEAARDDLAYSMTGNTKALFERTAGHFTGLGSDESAEQMNMTRTQSAGSEDQYSYLRDNGNVPIHHFDFNLSMLSTTDDSHSFDFLSDSLNEWPLEYDVSGGHVYRNYNVDSFQLYSPSTTFFGEYSYSMPTASWGVASQANDGAFHSSRMRENTWES